MSAPARSAWTAASGTVWIVVIAGSARSSVIATPLNRSSPRSRPVATARESEAGDGEVVERIERVREHHARHPCLDGRLEGEQVARAQLVQAEPHRGGSLLGGLVGGAQPREVRHGAEQRASRDRRRRSPRRRPRHGLGRPSTRVRQAPSPSPSPRRQPDRAPRSRRGSRSAVPTSSPPQPASAAEPRSAGQRARGAGPGTS